MACCGYDRLTCIAAGAVIADQEHYVARVGVAIGKQECLVGSKQKCKT